MAPMVGAAFWQGQLIVDLLARELKDFSTLTSRVLEQTKARVIQGNTHFKGKLLSIFETATEAIRKGKAAKPTEFGKMVKIQEAENQIVTDYEIYEERPADQTVLIPAIEKHKEIFDRAPDLVAGDAGFFSADNEAKAQELYHSFVNLPRHLRPQRLSQPNHGFAVRNCLAADPREITIDQIGPDFPFQSFVAPVLHML